MVKSIREGNDRVGQQIGNILRIIDGYWNALGFILFIYLFINAQNISKNIEKHSVYIFQPL